MIDRILELQDRIRWYNARLKVFNSERMEQKKKHPRAYENQPEWKKATKQRETLLKEMEPLHEEQSELMQQYYESLRVLDETMVNNICEKAKASQKSGAWALGRSCEQSRRNFADVIEIDEIIWEHERADFIAFCKECGIKKLALIENSTAFKGTLVALLNAGWKVTGVYHRRNPSIDARIATISWIDIHDRDGILVEIS